MSDRPEREPTSMNAGQKSAGSETHTAQGAANAGLALAEQFSKRIAEMQVLALPDMDALTTAHRRNMEALSAAYRAALEGAQELARRNGEIVRQAVADMQDAVRVVAGADTPQDKAAKQVELLKASYQRAVTNMRELSEIIQKANAEALGILSRRFSEGIDEVSALTTRFGSKPGS